MNCPVCGSQAEELPKSDADRYDIRCPECGEYSVLETAEIEFRKLTPSRRREELERAKKQARPGRRPIIRNIV